MNYKERLAFYLGTDKDKPHVDMNTSSIRDLTENVNTHDKVYDVPLKNLLRKTKNTEKKFSFSRGDVITQDQQNNWTLSKNRCEGNTSAVLLRSFNMDRHWRNYYNKPKDMSFDKKKSVVFWRGVSTGSSKHFSAKRWNPRPANRFTVVEKWFHKTPDIDIGFSFIHRDWLKPKYQDYVKGECNIEEFLRYKYILSIEGNDKDSGLSWKLNSNSLVLMPMPRVTSWLMETTLVPNKHYILLKDDFSDLHQKLQWCNNNPDQCITIIKNANNFMKQFSNNFNEEKLEKAVLNKYFELKSKFE
tara:strand:- start:2320 stop:3222 length:903 start_codon:yes stop_codon:yes gene_type:complete